MPLWAEKKDQSRPNGNTCWQNSERRSVDSSKEITRTAVSGVILPDIRQITSGFGARIEPLNDSGDGKSPSPQAKGYRSRRLAAPKHRNRRFAPAKADLSSRRLPHGDSSVCHAVAGAACSWAISDRMSANIYRDTTTAFIWKVT
jgi:hypothetical protein